MPTNTTCATCNTPLRIPNGNTMTCPACGTVMKAPSTKKKVENFFDRKFASISNAVSKVERKCSDAIRTTSGPVNIICPLGVVPGDTIQVPGNSGEMFAIFVPKSAVSGQPFTAIVPSRFYNAPRKQRPEAKVRALSGPTENLPPPPTDPEEPPPAFTGASAPPPPQYEDTDPAPPAFMDASAPPPPQHEDVDAYGL